MFNKYLAVLCVLLFATAAYAQSSLWNMSLLGGGGDPFSGVLLRKSAGAQDLTSGVVTDLTWDGEIYDTDSWHTGSEADVTVPAGVSYIRANCTVTWEQGDTGLRRVGIEVDGAGVVGANYAIQATQNIATLILQYQSGVIAVSEGDVITCAAHHTQAANREVTHSGTTFFSVEKVE